MKCPEIEKIDPYIFNLLLDEENDAFEEHFFHCDECFQELWVRTLIADVVKTEAKHWK